MNNPDENPNHARLEKIKNLAISTDVKAYMSLVCLGLIPAWEIEVQNANIDELESALIDAGFETRKFENQICFSNSIDNVDALLSLKERVENEGPTQEATIAFGRLYGFPETAIQAFTADSSGTIGRRDLPDEVQNQDYIFLAQYALSKDNWTTEIKTAENWAKALAENSPDIWHQFVQEFKYLRAINYGNQ